MLLRLNHQPGERDRCTIEASPNARAFGAMGLLCPWFLKSRVLSCDMDIIFLRSIAWLPLSEPCWIKLTISYTFPSSPPHSFLCSQNAVLGWAHWNHSVARASVPWQTVKESNPRLDHSHSFYLLSKERLQMLDRRLMGILVSLLISLLIPKARQHPCKPRASALVARRRREHRLAGARVGSSCFCFVLSLQSQVRTLARLEQKARQGANDHRASEKLIQVI